jgi:hypothetical protein
MTIHPYVGHFMSQDESQLNICEHPIRWGCSQIFSDCIYFVMNNMFESLVLVSRSCIYHQPRSMLENDLKHNKYLFDAIRPS